MATAMTSYIKTGAAVDLRTRDLISFAYLPRPQAQTWYVRFVEQGSVLVASTYVLYLGSSTVFLEISSSGSFYRAQYNNGISATVTSTLAAAPTVGQGVELLVTLTSTGVLQLSQAINGGAVSSATAAAARVLPTAWGASTLWLNSFSTAGVGINAFRHIRNVAGVKTMQEMRVWAGTD